MDITYNGTSNPKDMLTFSDVPNILTVKDVDNGDKAVISFTFQGALQQTVTADSQYYVTLLGETVTNVMSYSNATNKRFYISQNLPSTAASFAKALRNCSSLSANFEIINSGATVYVQARTIGPKFTESGYLERNIGSTYLTVDVSEGTAYNQLFGSQVSVDVYEDDTLGSQYVTTLEKSFYGGSVSFDVSPVLSTITEYGTGKFYSLYISAVSLSGDFSNLGRVSGTTTYGFKTATSSKYRLLDSIAFAMEDNGRELYTYGNVIPFSLVYGSNASRFAISISGYTADGEVAYKYNDIRSVGYPNRHIADFMEAVPQQFFHQLAYVDITVGTITKRFNVIKPIKMADTYVRLTWRNCYGGLSFMDFASQPTDKFETDAETYDRSIFGYYTENPYASRGVYRKDVTQTTTVESHLVPKKGTLFVEELLKSNKVTATVDGVVHEVVVKSCTANEDTAYSELYRITVEYEHGRH